MNKKIVQMSKEEILNTEFSFKLQSVLISDMYVPTGFIDIGLKGDYKTFYKEVENEHKLQKVSTLQVDLGSFNTLKEKYCNSSYSDFYGKSEIFTEENFINEIQKHLPILVIDSEVIKYNILIDKDFKFTKFISKAVAEYNINKDTLDIFYGTISEADLFIRTNGTCIENTNEHLDRLDDTFKEREPIIEDRMNQFIEDIKKENNPFLDFDKLVKEKNNKEDSHNAHYKAKKIDTIARCKANMTLEQQKAICIFNCDKYLHREKGQNLSDIQKVRYYLDWLEEIEIQLKDE